MSFKPYLEITKSSIDLAFTKKKIRQNSYSTAPLDHKYYDVIFDTSKTEKKNSLFNVVGR